MQDFNFVSPKTLNEVCRALSETGGKVIAGGTDVLPQMRSGRFKADWLIDLSKLGELHQVVQHNGWVTVGALVTYADVMRSAVLQHTAPLLVQASRTVGSIQTRHRGTLGGNIGNASPAGDALPPLLVLNTEVTLSSTSGERRMPLAELLIGPGKTAMAAGEVIREIEFESIPGDAKSLFLKLGNRQGMAVSVASAALVLQLDENNRVGDVRIALGAVAPTAIRLNQAEALLKGQLLTPELVEEAARSAAQECSPISDVRGTAAYRRHAVKVLVQRGLITLSSGAR